MEQHEDMQIDKQKVSKLAKLPSGYKIKKRPLLHEEIPSPYAGANRQKAVYISSKMPFMSAVSRVRKLLQPLERRQNQVELSRQKRYKGRRGHPQQPSTPTQKSTEDVMIKATGKAIDKALQLALYLQKQSDLDIKIKTGTATSIDDIVEDDQQNDVDGADELPESRIRQASVIEIGVTLTLR